jgi:hypothetical protein
MNITEVNMSNKIFYTQYGLGKVKYAVSFHDGVKTHKDGSPFYDIRLFSNKKELYKFEQKLLKENYKDKY